MPRMQHAILGSCFITRYLCLIMITLPGVVELVQCTLSSLCVVPVMVKPCVVCLVPALCVVLVMVTRLDYLR